MNRFKKYMLPYLGIALVFFLWLLKQLAFKTKFKKPYYIVLMHLVKNNKLFDVAWYLENNPDVANSGMNPHYHYIAYGDKEGRSPMPLFSPAFYKAKSKSRGRFVNTL